MGNCKGKQSKQNKSDARKEMYRPSKREPDQNNKKSNDKINEDVKLKQETESTRSSVDVNKDSQKVKNITEGDESKVKVSEESDAKLKVPEENDAKVRISEESTSIDKILGGGDVCNVKTLKKEKFVNGNQDKDKCSTELKDADKKTDVMIQAHKDERPEEKEKEDDRAKPFLFSRGNEDEMVESEFIDTKTGRADNDTKDIPSENHHQLGDQGSTQPQPEASRPAATDELQRTASQKDNPSDSIHPKGRQEANTGYTDSRFTNPIDSQDDHPPSKKKSATYIHITTNKAKNKKKRKEFFDPPINAQNVQNYFGHVGMINIGNDKVVINGIEQTSTPNTQEDFEPTFVISVEDMNMLTEVSKSVGYIHGAHTGTCFRVGNDKIMTAAHVVHQNIYNTLWGAPDEQKLSDLHVDFNYIEKRDSHSPDNKFRVVPLVLYMDETLDVAVLQLKKDKMPFPPPLKHFYSPDPKEHHDKEIYLISHSKGEKKGINGGVGLWTPTEKKLDELEKFCQEYGIPNSYTELDRADSLVVKCDFVGGASGSPGIIFRNKIPHVVMVYQRGFPFSYYSQQFPKEKKRTFPKNKLLQQGINIGSVYKDLSKKPHLLCLRDEIFSNDTQTRQRQMRHQYAMAGEKRDDAVYYGEEHVIHKISKTTSDVKNISIQDMTEHDERRDEKIVDHQEINVDTGSLAQATENTGSENKGQVSTVNTCTQPEQNDSFDQWLQLSPLFNDERKLAMLSDFDLLCIGKTLNAGTLDTLGLSLGYQNVDIEKIRLENQRDLCYHLLIKWKNKTGHAATVDKLLNFLHQAYLMDSGCVNVELLKTAISKIKS